MMRELAIHASVVLLLLGESLLMGPQWSGARAAPPTSPPPLPCYATESIAMGERYTRRTSNIDQRFTFTVRLAGGRSYYFSASSLAPTATVSFVDPPPGVLTRTTGLALQEDAFSLIVPSGPEAYYCGYLQSGFGAVDVAFRVVETTLIAPAWYVYPRVEITSYFSLANTTDTPVTAIVTLRRPGGWESSQTVTLGPNEPFVLDAKGFAGVDGEMGGSVTVAHTGPLGAIVGTVSLLDFLNQIARDVPFHLARPPF